MDKDNDLSPNNDGSAEGSTGSQPSHSAGEQNQPSKAGHNDNGSKANPEEHSPLAQGISGKYTEPTSGQPLPDRMPNDSKSGCESVQQTPPNPSDPSKFSIEGLRENIQRLMDQSSESVPSSLTITILEPDKEVAIDLWLFKYEPKTRSWKLSGIYQDGVLDRLRQLGFYKRYRPGANSYCFIHSRQNIIREVITAQMLDALKHYVEADQQPLQVHGCEATYQARSELLKRQSHLLFNDSFLQNLETHTLPILQDTVTSCYFLFQNCTVEVTKQGQVILRDYSALTDACIWKEQVIPFDYVFNQSTDCHFAHFITNVANNEPDRIKAFRTAIGYLIHNYNDPADGQAVICYDEELTDKQTPQGGTGKGVFGQAIRQVRPVAVIDGKKFNPEDRFCFQQVDQHTSVVWIDDPKPSFTLAPLYSILTEGLTVEKKGQDSYRIPSGESPKVLITTNTILSLEGSSNRRRQFILEFSSFYKDKLQPGRKANPIIEVHGCRFFTDEWDQTEWNCFYSYMIDCVRMYMLEGQQYCCSYNIKENWLLQQVGPDFYDWVTNYEGKGEGLQAHKEYETEVLYFDFTSRYSIDDLPKRGFTNNIILYARSKGWEYQRGRSNSKPWFVLKDPMGTRE